MTVASIVRTQDAAADPGRQPTVAEFFAGVGLARMGLEAAGFDRDKVHMYKVHFGTSDDHQLVHEDIGKVHGPDLSAGVGMAWASFPCIDLSLVGGA